MLSLKPVEHNANTQGMSKITDIGKMCLRSIPRLLAIL
ncbi:hypothetical protein [Sideroxydans sp. CL21]|nr:hypothetical protein [Sideroxydans sp. CL21]